MGCQLYHKAPRKSQAPLALAHNTNNTAAVEVRDQGRALKLKVLVDFLYFFFKLWISTGIESRLPRAVTVP